MHTQYSDGQDSPAEVLEWAERVGLDVIAITDHDCIDGAEIAADLAARSGTGPDVIVGEEVSSHDGHILGLFISRLIQPGMSAEDTVAAIHEQGGLAIAAHPFWRTGATDHNGCAYGVGDRIAKVDFDAIEVVNGGFTPSMVLANHRAIREARALGKVAVGGSDAHVKHAVGWAHTRFGGRSAIDLRASIVGGQTSAGRFGINPIGLHRYAMWSLGRLRVQTAQAAG
jgi:predicted metal-dependent phosphoesterase TrpH